MDVYLPIAEMSVNLFLLLGLGGAVGFLSGVFGVGGGFLMTPLLIFVGIPPAVAVGSEASQILASSFSGGIAHARRGNVDFRMGSVLVAGGLVGSAFGVWLFAVLRQMGQIDVVISLAYVVFLGTVGALMLVEFGAGVVPRAHQARHLYPTPSPPLAAWSAAQDPVPSLAPVHQRVHAAGPGLLRRHPRLDHGRGRRLSHGPGDDLPDRHADRGGGRDLAVSDQLRDRGHHLPARGQQLHRRHRPGPVADRRRRHRRAVRDQRRRPAARRAVAHPAGADRARGLRQARLRPDRHTRDLYSLGPATNS